MEIIGEVDKISKELDIQWKIENFYSLSGSCYQSAPFSFANATFCFFIYPKGKKNHESVGYIGIYISKISSSPPIHLEYSFSLNTFDGKKDLEQHVVSDFDLRGKAHGIHKFLSRYRLSEKRSVYTPSDVLTVILTLKYPYSTNYANNVESKEYSCCRTALEVDGDASSHEQDCMFKPLKCPECERVVALKDWHNHECQLAKAEASAKLSNDFKAILLSGDHSDTIITVKGEEFHLHRNILTARNSFFCSMFKNDMKEKKTGLVCIDDCEPGVFRSFIHFLYTGKVDTLSPENVCDLYEITDKYQENQLKNECLRFMLNTISIDSFCDFIVLSLKYGERKLLQSATEFFCCKVKEIIQNVKWHNFLREYPTQANELYLKAISRYDNK